MNPWDVFTWLMSATLGASALVIFAYFLKDLRGMLEDEREEEDHEKKHNRQRCRRQQQCC